MLTVIVGFEGSGKTRSRMPLSRRYSVMPSTDVTLETPLGSCWANANEEKDMAAVTVVTRAAAKRGNFIGCGGSFARSITGKEPLALVQSPLPGGSKDRFLAVAASMRRPAPVNHPR